MTRHRIIRIASRSPALAALVALTCGGCGGSPSPLKAGGPHQGVMIKLPESKGYAELVIESLVKPPARMAPSEVALYFLGADMATPISPPPTDVQVDIFNPETREKTPQKFAPSPKPGDAAGAARFATGPIPQDYSQFAIGGDLKANLNGPISVAF